MAARQVAAAILAIGLAGCAALSAERPIFPHADGGAPPIVEGVWISIRDECPEHNLRRRRFPAECGPIELRRQPDGAWRVALRVDLISNFSAQDRADEADNPNNGPFRVVLAPAVERSVAPGNYAPLYVAEVVSIERETPTIGYAVLAPIGVAPATAMRLNPMIGCATILYDGPIEGITPHYESRNDAEGQPHRELVGCTASTQAAVREAARRSVIEDSNFFSASRYVFVRAN